MIQIKRPPSPPPPPHSPTDTTSTSYLIFNWYLPIACHLNLQNLKDVQELLVEVSYKWYDIGIQLNMNPGDLDRIQSRYSDPADCLRVMLKEWLAGTNPYPTLESLAQALESRTMKKGQLANKVRQKLLERISITQLTSTTLQYPPPQPTFPQPHVASEPLYDNSPTTSHPSQHHVTSILLPHPSSQTPSQPYMAFEPSYQPSVPTPQTPQPQVMYNPAHTSSTTSHPPVLTDQVYHHHTHPPPGYDPPYLPITPTPSQQPYQLHPYDPVYLPKAPTTSNQPTHLHPHNLAYYPRAPTAMPSDPPQLPGVPSPSIPTHSYPQTAPSNHPHMQMAMNPTPHPPHCPYSIPPHPHYRYTQNASTLPHPHPHMQMATNPTTYPSPRPYSMPPHPHYVYIQSASIPPQPHAIPSATTPKLAPKPPDPTYYLPTQGMPPLPSTRTHPHPISSAATPIQDPIDPTYHPPSQRPPTHTPFTPYTSAPQMHPVDQYAKYLRAYYRRKKLPIASKWPPTASKKYIHLAVVKKDYVSKQQADEFTKATLHGNIEDIIREKESLDFSGIGKKEDGSPAQLIIVEGGPGIGKTTFAWKVCRKWSKGKILQQYRLVVLLRLRDKRVREARKVHDLFYHSNPKLREAVAAEMEAINGESVLLLYEGYDELPGKLQTQESIFLEILYQECLPEATVLITSRPSATQFLCRQFKKSIDQHIEILGFTKDDVYTYVQSVIKDQQLHREFTQYLKCYPHIRGLMYVPLNAVIVTEIYKTTKLDKSQEFVPTTLTELYTSLTRGMLLRYLTSHSEYGKQEWKLSSFSDLPEELHKQLHTICGIAFQGILKDEFIFDDLASDFNTLDLMQSASELYVDQGAVVSHNFFHLTLQEFLAAVHVSRQTTEIQLQYFLQSTPTWIEQQQREQVQERVYASGSLEDLDQLGYTSESFSESSRSSTPLEQLQYFIQSTPTWIEQQREQVQVREPVRERELVRERERVREPVRERERVRERGREQERGRERQQQIEPYFNERAQEEPEIKLLLQQQQRHSLSQDLDSSFTIGPSTSTSEHLTSILSEAPTILPQQGGVVPALQHRKRKSLQLIKMAHMQTTEPYTQERLYSSKQPRLQRQQLHGLMGEPESTTEHSTSSSQLPTSLASCVPESEFMQTSTLPRLSDVLPELQLARRKPLPLQGTPQALQTTPSLTTQDQGRLEPLQVPRPPSEPTPPLPESPAIPDTADNGRLQLETLQQEPHIPQQLLSQREVPPITNPRPVIPHTLPVPLPAGSLSYAVLTSSHFQNVVKFTAGLTKLRSLPIATLQSILLQDRGDYQEIPLYSLHWLFEAQCISKYSEMIAESTTLSFNHSGSMTPFDSFVLGYALSHINSTWNIDIQESHIGDEGLEMMVAGMNYKEATLPPSLKSISLDLRYCAISSVGLSHLKEMPEQVATRITELYLYGNTDISEAVASLLSNLTSLKILHLAYTDIGPREATALAEMLRRNKTLQLLDVVGNSIGEEGTIKLATSLEHNKTLKKLLIDRKYVHSLPPELHLKTKNRIIFF